MTTPRPSARRVLASLSMSLVALVAMTSAAVADGDARVREPDANRAVAILEYRAGSEAIASIHHRSADILRALTSLDIVDIDDARQRYGAELDADVVQCRGDAACIAGIGRKLAVAEVLLIGVSEFGDIILTYQRIDAASGQVYRRLAEALAPGSEPTRDALTDYLRQVLPKSDFRRWGLIRIATDIAGVTVRVGERERGHTPIAPLRVPAPATYDIALSKSGYATFRAQVMVPPDAEVEVNPVMSPASTAWYKRWWVVTALVGTVAAGVAVGVLASRSGDDDVPVVVDF